MRRLDGLSAFLVHNERSRSIISATRWMSIEAYNERMLYLCMAKS